MASTIRLGAVVLLAASAAAGAAAEEKGGGDRITPLLLAVHDAPMPFAGSDGRTHLVYELWITNFSSGDARVEGAGVLGDGKSLATLDAASVADRLQPAGCRDATATIPASGTSLLFVHVVLPAGTPAPPTLSHVVRAHVDAAPPGLQG